MSCYSLWLASSGARSPTRSQPHACAQHTHTCIGTHTYRERERETVQLYRRECPLCWTHLSRSGDNPRQERAASSAGGGPPLQITSVCVYACVGERAWVCGSAGPRRFRDPQGIYNTQRRRRRRVPTAAARRAGALAQCLLRCWLPARDCLSTVCVRERRRRRDGGGARLPPPLSLSLAHTRVCVCVCQGGFSGARVFRCAGQILCCRNAPDDA